MGRRSAASSSAFSRQIVRAIEQLRDRAELSNADLIRVADFSANYYYMRLRGEAPFNTNDLEKLAAAFGVPPFEILKIASSDSTSDDNDEGRTERVDGLELARRLKFLAKPATSDRSATFDVQPLVDSVQGRDANFSADTWQSLLKANDYLRVPSRQLSALSEFFNVDPRYLTFAKTDDEIAPRIEAEIEFQRALKTTGATAVTARALGEVSPNALRAITKAILSIDKET